MVYISIIISHMLQIILYIKTLPCQGLNRRPTAWEADDIPIPFAEIFNFITFQAPGRPLLPVQGTKIRVCSWLGISGWDGLLLRLLRSGQKAETDVRLWLRRWPRWRGKFSAFQDATMVSVFWLGGLRFKPRLGQKRFLFSFWVGCLSWVSDYAKW